jgi:competence protein ComEC
MSPSLMGIISGIIMFEFFNSIYGILFSGFLLFIFKYILKKNFLSRLMLWILLTIGLFTVSHTIFPSPTKQYGLNVVRVSKTYKNSRGGYWSKVWYGNGSSKYRKVDNNWSPGSYLLVSENENSRNGFNDIPFHASIKKDEVTSPKDLLRGMTLGGGIPNGKRLILTNVGLAHIMAISGLHMGVIAFFAFIFARLIHRRIPMGLMVDKGIIELLVVLPLVWIYWKKTGASVATTRAAIMISLFMIFSRYYGIGSSWSALLTAFAVMVVWNNHLLFTVSFQLSFAAVGGILLIYPLGKNRLGKYILTSLGAMGATMPLVYYHFGSINPLSIPVNLVLLPVFSMIILPIGIIGGVLSSIIPQIGFPFIWVGKSLLLIVIEICRWLLTLSARGNSFLELGFFILAWFFALIFALKPSLKASLFLIFSIIIALFSGELTADKRDILKVSFLSVRETDCTLIELPGKKRILIDAGDPQLAKFLLSRGITKIDYIYITHNHYDHYRGLKTLSGVVKVGKIFHNGDGTGEYLTPFRNKGTTIVSAPEKLSLKDTTITLLSSVEEGRAVREPFFDENNSSLIILFNWKDYSILFTGDLEKRGEELILRKSTKYSKVNMIKLGHHGHKTSSSHKFIELFNPQHAVIMGDKPDESTISRLKSSGIKVSIVSNEILTIKIKPRLSDSLSR